MVTIPSVAQMSLPDLIQLIEGDASGWLWSVGRCPCKSEDGAFSARVQSTDYEQPQMGLNLLTGQIVSIGGRGCDIFAHGHSPAEALAKAYSEAMGTPG